jgi:uncharacterized protein YyaL (SSP411 family)
VDWYPWGEEAFERARAEDKPVFLSVGYSACHWCHVMEHESFEDDETAAIMNDLFVNIKVDREERPDVDAIYMDAVQALTQRGGWPMSVWLTPDGRPFYGGTYFPPEDSMGMPGFKRVLRYVAQAYRERRDEVERSADELTGHIDRQISLTGTDDALTTDTLDAAFQAIARRFDADEGGFGGAPKFPPTNTLEVLLRMHYRHGWDHALEMVTHTLDKMARGGIYDQLGGGFHRYSVDARWLVPHFEKMLYDNALLTRIYLHAYQVTEDDLYRRIVEETLAYVQREMTDPGGGFYATQDADSEGHEGKFFIWTPDEIREVLGDDADLALDYWAVSDGPNFEGKSILWVPRDPEKIAEKHGLSVEQLAERIEGARQKLFDARESRVKPGRDDKIITAWNGLMLTGVAEAARVFERGDWLQMAVACAEFVLGALRREGRLLRTYKDGQAKFNGYLEDYAFMAEGLLELYYSTLDRRWFDEALALADTMLDLFWDDEAGFYDTTHDHEDLIVRPQSLSDGATPSGNSAAVAVLLRLAILAGRPDFQRKAAQVMAGLVPLMQQFPSGFGHLLTQLDFHLGEPHEIALVGDPEADDTLALLEVINRPYRPNQVLALARPGDGDIGEAIPLLASRHQLDGTATAYVCRNYTCKLPVNTPQALERDLQRDS